MSNVDLLVQKLEARNSSQLDSDKRAKEMLSDAHRRAQQFTELVKETLELPIGKNLLTVTHVHNNHELLLNGVLYKVEVVGLKIEIGGKTVSLKPILQHWEGEVPVRFFLDGTKDDSRSIVSRNDQWELSSPLTAMPPTIMDREGIAGLFVEMF